jgi:hypothetical protein
MVFMVQMVSAEARNKVVSAGNLAYYALIR